MCAYVNVCVYVYYQVYIGGCVLSGDLSSNFALQTMEPALPMPPVEELDVMFSELVVSLKLPSWRWLGAGRERRGCGWLGLVSHGLALLR